jgi:hypothetical protein
MKLLNFLLAKVTNLGYSADHLIGLIDYLVIIIIILLFDDFCIC